MSNTISIREYEQIKKDLERKKQEKNRCEGRLEQLRQDLNKKLGCKDLNAAKKKISVLKKKIQKKSKDLEDSFNKLKEEYGERIKQLG